MIIFLNEDRPYLAWVTHHRRGFVLDGKRKPKISHLVVHRATCRDIKVAASRRTHWTTGGKLKACGLDRNELETWASEETGQSPEHCSSCEPQNEVPQNDGPVHLSKLASDILEYVLEAALIHLEVEQPPYRLTVSDIATCFAKTPSQISPILHRLMESGFLALKGQKAADGTIPPKRIVLPTVIAMRTLESFQSASDSTIEDELAKLEPV
jgi:hypothetical protein